MTWEIASDSKKHVKAIADALAEDGELILATDPDREGRNKNKIKKNKKMKKNQTEFQIIDRVTE